MYSAFSKALLSNSDELGSSLCFLNSASSDIAEATLDAHGELMEDVF